MKDGYELLGLFTGESGVRNWGAFLRLCLNCLIVKMFEKSKMGWEVESHSVKIGVVVAEKQDKSY